MRLTEAFRLGADRVAFVKALGFAPDDWQRDLLRSNGKRLLLNCSRQSGKSSMAAVLALHRVLYYPNSLVLCLAPALRQSQELFSKIGSFYALLGEPMRKYGERRLSLELTNGSRIVTLPGSEKTIRGFSGVALLLVDEASRVDDELYFAIRPMLSVSGGSLVMLSTPAGRRGVFFEEWMNGLGWTKYEISADRCPRITDDFLTEERRSMPERMFRQEYCCSFEDDPDQVFTYDDVKAMEDPMLTPLFPEAA
jgi:hypothetical protein